MMNNVIRRSNSEPNGATPNSCILHLASFASKQSGFTLVEMIIVIVITGIIGSMVAVFLKTPIQQYLDVSRRADMTDIADTALRRIARDVRLALPNSVRVDPTGHFLEFLPTTSGGRYRAAAATTPTTTGCGSAAANVLDFTVADTCYEVLGAMPTPAVNVGDQIVVYNLGISGADAYHGNTAATDNRRQVSGVGTNTISITSAFPLPFDSPSHRFQVVTTPVSYVCDGAGTLWRYWGYPIQPNQPTTLATLNSLAGVQFARMANNVSSCSFSYNGFVVAQQYGLVTMNLGITENNETVTLYSATHVNNVP